MSGRSAQGSLYPSTAPIAHFLQSGVIPYRRTGPDVQVLLVTSNKRRRWIIPKGYVALGMSSAVSAAKEAWEEGGISGVVSKTPIGSYQYTK